MRNSYEFYEKEQTYIPPSEITPEANAKIEHFQKLIAISSLKRAIANRKVA